MSIETLDVTATGVLPTDASTETKQDLMIARWDASINGDNQIKVVQQGLIDTTNSTSTPLTGDATFTGSALNIRDYACILLSVYSDQASATDGLCVDKSHDGTNWYCSDSFTIPADTFKTFSFQAETSYYRVRYKNGATPQTTFTLQTKLTKNYSKPSSHRINDAITNEDDAELVKAVFTGINPDGIFTNVETTYNNSIKTSIVDGETGTRAEVEPLGAKKVIIPKRLVGTTFSNGTKDPNFWAETVTGTGSVTQAGEITLATGTTADSTSKYQTVRKARKVTGTTNQFRAVARNVETPAEDCIRRIGAYDGTSGVDGNGFFFQFDGETFSVVSRKNGTDTIVENGSFNGNAGPTIDFGGGTDFTRVIIDYTAISAKFFVDGLLIHTILPTTTSLTNTLNLPVTMEIINKNGNTTNNSYEILFATILRLGELDTEAEYKFINTNTTTICKYNAGRLKRILNVDNAGSVTVYDNTAASGTVIATIDTVKALGTLDFDIPFSNGLTVVTASGAKVVVVYE